MAPSFSFKVDGVPNVLGRCDLKSKSGLCGGCTDEGNPGVLLYRQRRSDGLKSSDIREVIRESMPVIPPAALTGGNCGS